MSEAMTGTTTGPAAARRDISRVDHVIQRIQEAILSGELPSGHRMPTEADLAEQLAVSRTPLREAVKVLEAVGVLEIRRGVGTFVRPDAQHALAQLTLFQDLVKGATPQDLYEARFMFERTAAELAARNRSEEDLQRLRTANERLRVLAADPEATLEETTDADVAFHFIVYEACGNALIATLGRYVTTMFKPWIQESLSRAGGTAAAGTHELVLQMIAAQHAGGARECWTEHAVSEGLDHWRRSLEQPGPTRS